MGLETSNTMDVVCESEERWQFFGFWTHCRIGVSHIGAVSRDVNVKVFFCGLQVDWVIKVHALLVLKLPVSPHQVAASCCHCQQHWTESNNSERGLRSQNIRIITISLPIEHVLCSLRSVVCTHKPPLVIYILHLKLVSQINGTICHFNKETKEPRLNSECSCRSGLNVSKQQQHYRGTTVT